MNKTNNDNTLLELEKLIKSLRAEVTYARTVFDSSTKLAVTELKANKIIVAEAAEKINSSISKAADNLQKFDSACDALTIVPNKIDDRLDGFPKSFNESIANSIPDLSNKLSDNFKKRVDDFLNDSESRLKSSIDSFKIQSEAALLTNNRQMTEAMHQLKGNADQLYYDMKNELEMYSQSLETIIRKGGKFRMKAFFWTVLISSFVSSVMSITTFWLIVKI